MSILKCFCCGADVTMPQFFNGNAYGYTCILKVNPTQKQVKIKWFLADSVVRIDQPVMTQARVYPVVIINGNRVKLDVAYSVDGDNNNLVGRDGSYKIVNGVCYVNEELNNKYLQAEVKAVEANQDVFALLAAMNK